MPQLRDISKKQRDAMPKADFAGKNKSFPIKTPKDVEDAAKAIGRAGDDNYDTETLKKNIIRIAKRKGPSYVAKLPKAWNDKSDKKAAKLPVPSIALRALPTLLLHAEPVAGDTKRSWIEVTKIGKFVSPVYGKFEITRQDLAQMLSNFKTVTPVKPTELSVDYNHLAVDPKTPEQGKAAGWVKDVELRGDGAELWAQVEWTPPAAEAIANQEYRYVSAHFAFNHTHIDGQKIGTTLLSIGITNRPFVEGMQPMTIAASKGRDVAFELAAEDDEAAESKFSFDEIRRRLNDAIREEFGVMRVHDWGESCDCWLVDVFDEYAVFRQDDACYRVDYTLGEDGVITFTSDPTEVVNNWAPVSATPELSGGTRPMAKTIKLTDARGTAVEISEEVFAAAVAEHAEGADARLTQVQTALTASQQEVVQLTARTLALETTLKERDLTVKIEGFIKAGKATQAEREAMLKLGKKDEALLDELYGSRAVVVQLNHESGSAEDVPGGGVSAAERVAAEAEKLLEKDPKLTRADANAMVFRRDPTLYEAYRKESSIRV